MDHREHYRRAQAELADQIAAVDDNQLDLPTPCSAWTVRDLLRHVVEVGYNEAAAFAGQSYDASADPRLDGDPRELFADASAQALEAIADDAVLERTVSFVGRNLPGSVRISFHFLDTYTHIWDLRKSLRAKGELDPDLAAAGVKVAGLIPDEEWVRGPGKAFGMIVPVPADASVVDRMLGLLGRSPDWASA